MKILILGNCQTMQYAALLGSVPGHQVTRLAFADLAPDAPPEVVEKRRLKRYDLVLAQDAHRQRYPVYWKRVAAHPNAVLLPSFAFRGFHPDIVDFRHGGKVMSGSAIAVFGCRMGLTRDEAARLYSPSFAEAAGYYDVFAPQKRMLTAVMSGYMPEAGFAFDRWYDRGVFCHTHNHPRLHVIEDMMRALLAGRDVTLPEEGVSDLLGDPLQPFGAFPAVNHPRARLRLDTQDVRFMLGGRLMDRDTYLARQYAFHEAHRDAVELIEPERETRFAEALERWRAAAPGRPAGNPYAGRPPQTQWSRAVVRPAADAVAPTARLTPVIGPRTRVATAGSCFAQHIARTLKQTGLTYFVAEEAPEGMTPEEAQARTYGLFSARYGNIYTPRQLLQLIDRAYGRFEPLPRLWRAKGEPASGSGGGMNLIDPFRPNIGETWPTPEALAEAQQAHLATVRHMLETLDVFVFTLGLTEAWVDRRDGAVFPVAPGVVAADADAGPLVFENYGAEAVRADMRAILSRLKRVNPKARVILTVSPVPLIATASENDALTATTWSKAVLRTVAGELSDTYASVQYFPSFEIITGTHARGAYFDEDLRTVRPEGVAHVMRVFMERLVSRDGAPPPPAEEESAPIDAAYRRQMEIVCDEELVTADL